MLSNLDCTLLDTLSKPFPSSPNRFLSFVVFKIKVCFRICRSRIHKRQYASEDRNESAIIWHKFGTIGLNFQTYSAGYGFFLKEMTKEFNTKTDFKKLWQNSIEIASWYFTPCKRKSKQCVVVHITKFRALIKTSYFQFCITFWTYAS